VASNDALARALDTVEMDLPDLPVPAHSEADELSTSERLEVQSYLDQLYASGRKDLADRVAASLVINSASATASRSSNT